MAPPARRRDRFEHSGDAFARTGEAFALTGDRLAGQDAFALTGDSIAEGREPILLGEAPGQRPLTINCNNSQASYTGGDGNNLALTVQ